MNLIAKSFSICLNKETFSFQNEKILGLNIFMASNHFCVKINKKKLKLSNVNPIKFNSQQIQTFDFNFLSDQQLAPAYSINEHLFPLIAPKILLIPQLSIPKISSFYTNKKDKTLASGTILFSLEFNTDSILPILKTYDEIIDRNRLDSAVLNYGFIHNVSQMVTQEAALGLN